MKKMMGSRALPVLGAAFAALALAVCALLGFYAAVIPRTVSCFGDSVAPSYFGATFEADAASVECVGAKGASESGKYKLFGAIPVRAVTLNRLEDAELYVGGVPFGVKFLTRGATVVGFEDEAKNPAFAAGLRLYDVIIYVNGKSTPSVSELSEIVSHGSELSLTVLRAGKERVIKFKPRYSEAEGKYVLGLYLKDSGAGIGTLTFVTEDGTFGGLGHGICDSETGALVSLGSGSVLGVTLNGIVRGQRGDPGELKGYFNSSKLGSLAKNCDVGVFGRLASVPAEICTKRYRIGLKNELKEGAATLICTLDDNERREYAIEISSINLNATGNKCFTVKICDSALISKTGGIVQGMSGSPIIQNGKLVGAVTHVMINDPTVGYGIFIENMLAQAYGAEQRAA